MSRTDAAGRVGQGPRAVEAALLDELEAACAPGAARPERLAEPLRVVLPSESLRAHLSARLLERRGEAVLGVKLQTAASAARELLEHAGEAPLEPYLSGIAVRAAARREPALARELDPLDDGYATVLASVDDLLDAGFRPEHAEPLAEVLAEQPLGRSRDRAEALLRVALATALEIEAGTLGHRCVPYARAAERLRTEGASALPTRALWLHGFSDATGVLLDWLEALRTVLGAALWIDLPGAGEWRFGSRLRERLAVAVPGELLPCPVTATAEKSKHCDRESEARAAARWARQRIEAGIAPERVGVLARDLSTHRLALRRQLARAGVPFSGAQERGGSLPLARRLDACWSLVERGGALPVGRWLEARADLGLAERADLRDACAALGAARLADAAQLGGAPLGEGLALAAPAGLVPGRDGEPRVRSRRVEPAQLRALRDRARGALHRLESWPAEAALVERLAALFELGEALGWRADGPERAALEEVFPEVWRAGPRPVPRGDWSRLLRRALASAGSDPLGGLGGGVQVLSSMEARGQTFDALWVLGMERGVFPRRVSEDPLLPDSLRIALRAVLPDLPVKGEGREEERFLFAQLCSASAVLHLSRAQRDERGHSVQPSPLFESFDATEVELTDAEPERLDSEEALEAALVAARSAAGLDPADCAPVARARLAVRDELESRRSGLGPYLGVLGPAGRGLDPRGAAPYVTLLEGLAHCPWQAFLRRMLRVAPSADPHGPLPEASDRRLLGNAIHAALQSLCDPGASATPWPDAAPRDAIERATAATLRREGIALTGYEVALARRVTPFVEVARRLDAASDWQIEGVEVKASAALDGFPGGPRELRFKADREERRGEARRFTDWKTGRLKLDQSRAAARSEALRKAIAGGDMLQGHAYARAAGAGRYVFLEPEADDALREVEVEPEGPQREAFEDAVATLLGALDAGALPPRLRQPDRDEEPRRCRDCDVKQACSRGDSGLRARLGGWAESESETGEHDRAGRALWWLGVEP